MKYLSHYQSFVNSANFVIQSSLNESETQSKIYELFVTKFTHFQQNPVKLKSVNSSLFAKFINRISKIDKNFISTKYD